MELDTCITMIKFFAYTDFWILWIPMGNCCKRLHRNPYWFLIWIWDAVDSYGKPCGKLS